MQYGELLNEQRYDRESGHAWPCMIIVIKSKTKNEAENVADIRISTYKITCVNNETYLLLSTYKCCRSGSH